MSRMLRLLGMLYVVLVTSEAKPKRGWRQRMARKRPNSLLSFVESDWKTGPAKVVQEPDTRTASPTEIKLAEAKLALLAPITLVEKERASAVRLSMPEIPSMGDFVHIEDRPERFDTPIGRTLTEDFLRNRGRCPSVAIRHIPVNDAARDLLSRRAAHPHGSSPRRAATEKKGLPTPKRPRKSHGAY